MMRFTVLLITFTVGLNATLMAQRQGQDYKKMREELVEKQEITRAEINKLNEQIEQFQERLSLTEQKYDRLYNQYENLQRIIALQEDKITKLEEEQQHIQQEINLTEQEINQIEQNLQELKENYKQTLKYVYKHGRASQMALIFSSNSMNQMLVRTYYLKRFENYRQEQLRQIQTAQTELKNNKQELERSREDNAAVLTEIQAEKREQEDKKKLQERNISLLQRDRQQIKNELEAKQRQLERLNNTLSNLTMEEERVRRTNLSAGGTMDDAALTEIENSFAEKKGALPWPVESSTISEHYGNRRHPVYGTITPNPGIEIVTKSQAPVRVIHDGYVVAVQPITGYGDVVVVSHGKYITAYGNLSKVMVRRNAILMEGDIIGLAGDADSSRGESVFFMVRENNTNVDPETWIREK